MGRIYQSKFFRWAFQQVLFAALHRLITQTDRPLVQMPTCFLSAGSGPGVIYNQGTNNEMSFLSSAQCIFEGNFAQGGGAVFQISELHNFSSTNNVYVRNSGSISVLSARDSNVVMADDIIGSNMGAIV